MMTSSIYEMTFRLAVITCVWSTYCVYVCYGATPALELSLYRDLFMNYSTSLRPIYGTEKQIEVRAQFGLVQIEGLNEKNQQLTSHAFITLSWLDELLTWNTSQYDGLSFIIVNANEVWLPEITPTNSVKGGTELASMRDDTRVRIFSTGRVIWIPAFKMETTCDIDVTDFPYDSQICEAIFANWMYTASLLNYSADPLVMMEAFETNQAWNLTNSTGYTDMLKLRMWLKRNPTFFELNVMLPSMLMSFMLIPVFILPVESGEKVSLGVTLMLAYSIFLLMLTDVTPKSGTTPRLTVAILISTVASGMSILTSVFIINVHHHTPYKPVPNWIKRNIILRLGRVLCCLKYIDNDVVPAEDNVKPINGKSTGIGPEFSPHKKAYADVMSRDDEIDVNKDNWNKVARVLDRLFFCLYSVYFVVNLFYVLSLKLSF